MGFLKKWATESVMFLTYALFAVAWKVGDWFITHLGFHKIELGVMTNAISVAKIVGALSTAVLVSRWGSRNLFTYASILVSVCLFIPFFDTFSVTFLLRFIMGLGGAIALVTINSVVAKLFTDKGLTLVNGLNGLAFNCGLAVALTFSDSMSRRPEPFLILCGALLLGLSILWRLLTGHLPSEKATLQNESYSMKEGFKDPFNWAFTFSHAGLLSFYLVSFTFMQPSVVRWVIYSGILGSFVGTLSARVVKNKLFMTRLCAFLQLLSAGCFLMFYDAPSAKFWAAVLGFFIFLPVSAFMTLAFIRENSTSEKVAVTFSIFWSFSYIFSIFAVQTFAYLSTYYPQGLSFTFILLVESSFFIGTTFLIKKSALKI